MLSTRATKAATVPRTKYRRQPSSGVVGPRGGGPTQSWGPQGPRGTGPSGAGSSSASSSCQIREAYSVWKRPSAPGAGVGRDPVSPRSLAMEFPPKVTGTNPIHNPSQAAGRWASGSQGGHSLGCLDRAPRQANLDSIWAPQEASQLTCSFPFGLARGVGRWLAGQFFSTGLPQRTSWRLELPTRVIWVPPHHVQIDCDHGLLPGFLCI